jgi:predicted phage gp36 major capsid-like protein
VSRLSGRELKVFTQRDLKLARKMRIDLGGGAVDQIPELESEDAEISGRQEQAGSEIEEYNPEIEEDAERMDLIEAYGLLHAEQKAREEAIMRLTTALQSINNSQLALISFEKKNVSLARTVRLQRFALVASAVLPAALIFALMTR